MVGVALVRAAFPPLVVFLSAWDALRIIVCLAVAVCVSSLYELFLSSVKVHKGHRAGTTV